MAQNTHHQTLANLWCRSGGIGRRTGLKIHVKGIRQVQDRSRIPCRFLLLSDFNELY
jgi:hypothetical protein